MKNAFLLGLAVCLLTAGCSSNRSTEVRQDPAKKLGGYSTINVRVRAADPAHQGYVDPLWEVFQKVAAKSDLKQTISRGESDGTGLFLDLNLTGAKKGDKLKRAFNMWGDAELTVDAELHDASGRIAAFTVKGDSRKSTWSLSFCDATFFNTAWFKGFDDLDKRAMAAVDRAVVEYLEKHN